MERRGFLGRLAALVVAPVVAAKVAPPKPLSPAVVPPEAMVHYHDGLYTLADIVDDGTLNEPLFYATGGSVYYGDVPDEWWRRRRPVVYGVSRARYPLRSLSPRVPA